MNFANFTLPTLKTFLEAHSQNVFDNKQQLVACAIGCPETHFFHAFFHLLVSQKMMQRHSFSTVHPLSPVIFATATVVAFVLLRNSRFSFHCYSFIHSVKQRLLRNQPGSDAATSCTKDYKGHSPVQTSFTEPPNSETQLH